MARESQGLQIALIILFILTIILGVTTYIFCSQYIEADGNARNTQAEAAKTRAANQTIQDDNNKLKKWILGTPDAEEKTIDELAARFNQDMLDYGSGLAEEDRYYGPALEQLYKMEKKRTAALSDAKDDLGDMQSQCDQRIKEMQKQLDVTTSAFAEAEKKFKAFVATYSGNLDQIRTEKDEIEKIWNAAREKFSQDLTVVETERDDAVTTAKQLKTQRDQLAEEVEDVRAGLPDVPDGTITWVDQRRGMVWIDLGRGDALRRLTTFSVYPIDLTDPAKEGVKARIEVTRIRGEHAAEARIVEDVAADPIMTGDKIYTPVWSPGEQVRFALVGLMDMDGDGNSDLQTVKELIGMSGGAVDFWIDDKGSQNGKMTIHTRYYVVDYEALDIKEEANEAKAAEAGAAAGAYTPVIRQAEELGLKKIILRELLRQMGWKSQTRVVRFGLDSDPRDFAPKPAEGIRRGTGGNSGDRFQPRRPSSGQLSPRGGAY